MSDALIFPSRCLETFLGARKPLRNNVGSSEQQMSERYASLASRWKPSGDEQGLYRVSTVRIVDVERSAALSTP